jgi:hypothetical protein
MTFMAVLSGEGVKPSPYKHPRFGAGEIGPGQGIN